MIDQMRPSTIGGTERRHDGLSIALHWLVVIAVVLTYGLGIGREAVPRGPYREAIGVLHASMGLLVLAGALLRIAWHAGRRGFGLAAPPVSRAGRLAHFALYAGMIAVPLAVLVMVWTRGQSVPFFGIAELPQLMPVNRSTAKLLEEVHEFMAHGLIALAGLHAAAALFHHHVLRDGILRGMLPRLR